MEVKKIAGKLNEYGKTRIDEIEMRKIISIRDYDAYYEIVLKLIECNIITPVKSSGSNGMRPPLHKKYNIVKPPTDQHEFIPEIRLLNEKLNIEGYLNDPEKYIKHRSWIITIDNFLKNEVEKLKIPCSINERSFQIFQKEKALRENRELAAVLGFNEGLTEALNFYNTPEPFHAYYISPINEGFTDRILNILIIENKDTWYTLRNRIAPGLSNIAGIEFHCLLYGEGKKISRVNDSLTDFDLSFFKGANTCYYYFGDLDYEGINIAQNLIKTNPTLKIKLMLPLYYAMLDASEGIALPVSSVNQKNSDCDWFLSFFDSKRRNMIMSILESGHYIPQEILGNSEFIKLVCRNSQSGGTSHV